MYYIQVIDQVVGAISRFILTDSGHVPVNDIVPVLMNNLPLKSDETEYENVFKALCKLYAAGNSFLYLLEFLDVWVYFKSIFFSSKLQFFIKYIDDFWRNGIG